MACGGLRSIAFLSVLLFALAACGADDDEPGGPGAGGAGGSAGTGGEGGDGGSGGADDEGIRLPGLEQEAEVRWDARGIPHIRCEAELDCMRLLGYAHASHRFAQMDMQRRVARGRLGTLVPLMVDLDPEMRLMLSTREGVPLEDAIWDEMDDDTREVLEAYAEGINGWLADLRAGRNGARLSDEYFVPFVVTASPATIPDWEAKDSVAIARLIAFFLSDSSQEEIAFGNAFAKLAEKAPELARDVFTLAPAARSYTVQPSGVAALRAPTGKTKGGDALVERLRQSAALLEKGMEWSFGGSFSPRIDGSNNWVIAPSRTENGVAILANDPHLGMENPPAFFLAHLDASSGGGMKVAGATFPGTPAVVIGHNERVAWGATVAFYDVTDVYVETLNDDGSAVLFEGKEVPLLRKKLSFQGGASGSIERELHWVPHHGPVIAWDPEAKRALSVRWTGHEPSNEIAAYLGLARAGGVADAAEALRHFRVGAQNFVLADRSGAIAWLPHADVPHRPWASYSETEEGEVPLPPWMPLPGDGSAEWQGSIPTGELPSLVDPPSGFIATANQDLTGATEGGDPTTTGGLFLQSLADPGVRHQRIVDRIEKGGDRHDVAYSQALQMDDHSLLGEWIAPALVAAAEGESEELSPVVLRVVQVLKGWDFRCPTGLAGTDPEGPASQDAEVRAASAGCTAFHFVLPALVEGALGDALRAAGSPHRDPHILLRSLVIALQRPEELHSGEAFWHRLDGTVRSKEEVLVQALRDGAAALANELGEEPAGWLWGRVHTVTLESPLSIVSSRFNLGPYAASGGLFTVNVANPPLEGKSKEMRHGAALRLVCELSSEGVQTWLQLPGGQSLDRDGAHHDDWVEDWLAGRSYRLPFDEAAVEEAVVERWRVVPVEDEVAAP